MLSILSEGQSLYHSNVFKIYPAAYMSSYASGKVLCNKYLGVELLGYRMAHLQRTCVLFDCFRKRLPYLLAYTPTAA